MSIDEVKRVVSREGGYDFEAHTHTHGMADASLATLRSFDRGRLLVDHLVGTGAMAAVFKCTVAGSSPPQHSAVKRVFHRVADPPTAQDTKLIAEWRREAEILSALSGRPHVVHYRSHFIDDAFLCIETEYMEGGSLLEFMRADSTRRNGLPETIVVSYVAQIASALLDMHNTGYIHSDVKAANVLLSKDFEVAKLADFGLSQSYNRAAYSSRNAPDKLPDIDELTSAQHDAAPITLQGSVFWMSPRLMLTGVATPADDVWSLGCLTIELLTGHPPFFDFTTKASAVFHISQLREDPTEQWRDVPNLSPLAEDFLRSTLRIAENERATCAELVAHRWLTPPRNVVAHRGTPPPPSPAFARSGSLNSVLPAAPDAARELVRTVEQFCVPSRPDLLARWLFGVDDPLHAVSATAALPCCFVVRHEGLMRGAKNTIALLGNVLADAVTAWRADRLHPTTSASSDGDAATRRVSLRLLACSVLINLGRVAQRWKDHTNAMIDHCLLVTTNASSSTTTTTTWQDQLGKEEELLKSYNDPQAALSIGFMWIILDALAQTNFWTYCDIGEMFAEEVSLVRPGHEPSPDRGTPSYTGDPLDRSSTSTMPEQPDTTSWTPAEGGDEDASAVDGGEAITDALSVTRRAENAPISTVQLYHQAAMAILALHSVSLVSVAVPSASAVAGRCSSAAAGSTWAITGLLKYNPTRAKMLKALAGALEADRKIRRLPRAMDAVIATSVLRLGDISYVQAAFGPTAEWSSSMLLRPSMTTTTTTTASVLAAQIPRTTALLACLVAFAPTLNRQDQATREAFLNSMTVLFCLMHLSGGGLHGGPPNVVLMDGEQTPRVIGDVLSSLECSRILAAAETGHCLTCRCTARAAMILFASMDRDLARAKFALGPFLAAATDPQLPYHLRVACAASVFDVIDDQIPPKAALQLLTGHRTSIMPARLFAPVLEVKPPFVHLTGVDPMVSIVSRLVQARPEAAVVLCDDTSLLRAALRKLRYVRTLLLSEAVAGGSTNPPSPPAAALRRMRWELLVLLRSLYEHASDPGRFCDSSELLEELMEIANDAGSAGGVRVAACELLNSFASVAVF